MSRCPQVACCLPFHRLGSDTAKRRSQQGQTIQPDDTCTSQLLACLVFITSGQVAINQLSLRSNDSK